MPVPGLQFTAEANTDYEFSAIIPYQGTEVEFEMTGPLGNKLLVYTSDVQDSVAILTGLILGGPTAGRVAVEFRPTAVGATATVEAGALLRWHTY